MTKHTPKKSAPSRLGSRNKFAIARLIELIGGAELSRRSGLPKNLFYNLKHDARRGRDVRVSSELAAQIYDAAGAHMLDVQKARRQLRWHAFIQRRRRKQGEGE